MDIPIIAGARLYVNSFYNYADPDSLYDSIKLLMDNPDTLAEIGVKSKIFVEKQHDIKETYI